MASDLSACGSCLCLASRQAARAITRIFDREMRRHGLKTTQFSVLVMLALRGSLPLGKLAAFLGLERTTLTRSLDILEKKGLIASEAAEDARRRQVRITPAGRRRVDGALPAWRTAQEGVRRRLGPAGSAALQGFASELTA
jgi:DNA-binding MarR family transcriptional regulator